MRTITTLALSRIKYNKSRTVLTAVSVMLTTVLLAGLVTSALGMLDVNKQQALTAGNTHATFSGLSAKQAEMLKNHMDIEAVDISELFATIDYDKMNGTLTCEKQLKEGIYYRAGNLIEGHEPVAADEICGSKAFFERMNVEPVIGNKMSISFRPHGEGMIETREFTICGIVSQIDVAGLGISDSRLAYAASVSEALAEEYFTPQEREYRANIRVYGEEELNYDAISEKIEAVAADIGCEADKVSLNKAYLYTMTDPGTETMQIVCMIALGVIFFAGLVIYSIYYVSVITDVQEIGKLKAVGASDKQIRKMLLSEGMRISVFSIPAGLALGYLIPRLVLPIVMKRAIAENVTASEVEKIHMFSLPLLLLVAAAVLLLVAVSLRKPLKMAAKISPIEAIRYQESSSAKKIRKGNRSVTLIRLSAANLIRNKKRTLVTMVTMGLSCVLFMCLAGVMSSIRAEDLARRNIEKGDFKLCLDYASNDAEYPENNLNMMQKNNIFNEAFIRQMEAIDGVESIEHGKKALISSDYPSKIFIDGERQVMLCMDRELCEQYRREIKRGTIDYDMLTAECGVVFLSDYFFDELGFAIGDIVPLTVYDGDREVSISAKIEATVDTGDSGYFALPEDIFEALLETDATYTLYITADPAKYDSVKAALQEIADAEKYFILYSMDEEMEIGKWGINLIKYPLYAILAMIAVISFMNLINTMMISIITRKRELGILQAIGLTDKQLAKMLAGEGLVFSAGTLFASLTVGNLFGYLVFVWAKEMKFMDLTVYHYPLVETILLILVLLLGQLGVTYFISKHLRKESLVERIRSGE